MLISVLALDDAFDSGLSLLLDAFEFANLLGRDVGRSAPRFEVRTVGLRKRITTHRGLRLDVQDGLETAARSDVVIVPALFVASPEQMMTALERSDVREACAALREQGARRSRPMLASACTGTFVAAATTLLDGRRATTAWWLAPAFRKRFPKVELDESKMVVSERRVVTAGAALAHVDLALWLVRRHSPALATMVARYLLVEARPSQAVFISPDHLAHQDPVLERFERFARRRLAEGFSLDEAARAVGTSARSLERRVRAILGKSPISFVQDLRVELASHLLQTTDEGMDQIAEKVGYRDAVTLRALLRKKLGVGVREIRRRRSAA